LTSPLVSTECILKLLLPKFEQTRYMESNNILVAGGKGFEPVQGHIQSTFLRLVVVRPPGLTPT